MKEPLVPEKEIMTTTLFTSDKYVAWYIPFIRIIDQVLSFTTGSAGGVFAPALGAGASIGSLISSWLHLLIPTQICLFFAAW
jgi:H+/Cl- antiporter ClcA